MGGWICAQESEVAENHDSIDAYWIERLKAAHESGFDYWKVDWGIQSRNDKWRRNLTRLGRTHAPNLYIEHAMKMNMLSLVMCSVPMMWRILLLRLSPFSG